MANEGRSYALLRNAPKTRINRFYSPHLSSYLFLKKMRLNAPMAFYWVKFLWAATFAFLEGLRITEPQLFYRFFKK
jgi:hypothetical protein